MTSNSNRAKRHHFVPKFLLRRFATNPIAQNPRAWVFRRGQDPCHESVDNIAVVCGLYNLPLSNLEGKFAGSESKIAAAMQQLPRGARAPASPELRPLLLMLLIRGSYCRGILNETVCHLVQLLRDSVSVFARSDPIQSILHPGSQAISIPTDLTPFEWYARSAADCVAWSSVHAFDRLNADRLDALWAVAIARMWDAINAPTCARESAALPALRVAEIVNLEGSLLFPDFAVFALYSDGQWLPFPASVADPTSLLIPLSPYQVLLMSPHAGFDLPDTNLLNAAARKYAVNWVIGSCVNSTLSLESRAEHPVRQTSLWSTSIEPQISQIVRQQAVEIQAFHTEIYNSLLLILRNAPVEATNRSMDEHERKRLIRDIAIEKRTLVRQLAEANADRKSVV